MISKIIKYSCFGLLLYLLLIPVIKQYTSVLNGVFEADPLKGYFPPVDSAYLNIKNWMDGSFQKNTEEFLKRDLKIRPYAVRVNNQLHYNFLKEIRRDIVEGKENYLFEVGYIHEMQGLNFIGEERIKTQSKKLRVVSELLSKNNNTDILVAIPISKARFHKDKLPQQYDLSAKNNTNYEMYLNYLKENEIHVLDFNQYFIDQKKNIPHQLSPKHGIHWSMYGGMLAADSILSYVGKLKNKPINLIYKEDIEITTEARKEDNDIGKSINLYKPLPPDTFTYFNNYFLKEFNEFKPNILLIGDSFSWTIWGNDIPHRLWGDSTLFLYYYNEVWDTKWTALSGSQLKEEQIRPFAERCDAIFLLYNPANLNNLGSNFIDKTFEKLGGFYNGANDFFDQKYVSKIQDPKQLGFKINADAPNETVLLKKENLKLQAGVSYQLSLKINTQHDFSFYLKKDNELIWKSVLKNEEPTFFEELVFENDYDGVMLGVEKGASDVEASESFIYDISFYEKL